MTIVGKNAPFCKDKMKKKAFSPPPRSPCASISLSPCDAIIVALSKAKHPWIISFVWHYFTGCGDGRREHASERERDVCFLGCAVFPSRTIHWDGDGRTHPAPQYIHIFVFLASSPPWMDGWMVRHQCSPLNLALFIIAAHASFFLHALPLRSLPPCPVRVYYVRGWSGDPCATANSKGANLAKAYGGAFFFFWSFFSLCGALQNGSNLSPPRPIIHHTQRFFFFCRISQIRDNTLLVVLPRVGCSYKSPFSLHSQIKHKA